MNRILDIKTDSNATHLALLITRIGIATLMLTFHGIPKLITLFSGEPVQFVSIMGMSAELSLGLAVFAEVICSILLLFGFATRLVVIPLAVTMLFAVFMFHAADPLPAKEPGLQYLLVYILLFLTGSGKFSIDYLLKGKKIKANYNEQAVKIPQPAISQ